MLGATAEHLGANNNNNNHGPSSLPAVSCNHRESTSREGQSVHVILQGQKDAHKSTESSTSTASDVVRDEQTSQAMSRNSSSSIDSCTSSDSNSELDISPYACLFCNQFIAPECPKLASTVAHMQSAHGLFIPHPNRLLDLQSFIEYLSATIHTWHECLSCGVIKGSTVSIQNHMRDKGHCCLNFEREPGLMDFWERDDESDRVSGDSDESDGEARRPTVLDDEHEKHLPSGRTITSKYAAPRRPPPPSSRLSTSLTVHTRLPPTPILTPPSTALSLLPSRQSNNSRRTELSLAGVSHQALRAIVIAEKQAQRSEAMARRAKEWVNARGANTQKFDQLDTTKMGKRGKQTHKLLPR